MGSRLAHPKNVAIGVANVHFANTPGLVSGRLQDLDVGALTRGVQRVDIVDPDRKPHAVVGATSTLTILTQENLPVA